MGEGTGKHLASGPTEAWGCGEVAGFAAGQVGFGQMVKRRERRMVPLLTSDPIWGRK